MGQIIRGAPPNGSGSGDGSGYGYGSRDGSGGGSGDGSGYGDGYGSGYGDGYGDGYGSGSGDGSGGGYGDGYGSGDGEYWAACLNAYAERLSRAAYSRLQKLKSEGAVIAYWKSDAEGRACNGGRNAPVTPGSIETSPGPLSLCERGTLHATHIPPKWRGERLWIVALIGEVIGDAEKFGALKREIIGEVV